MMDDAAPEFRLSQAKPAIIPTRQVLVGFPPVDVPPGHYFWLEISGYHTFDEGLQFYTRLETFNEYVRAAGLIESCVDRILVCISRKETHIYANDRLPMTAKMRAKRSIKAGEGVSRDDIAGITRVDFPGICPPVACGFLLLVSVGWRKAMCFDLRPLDPDGQDTSTAAFENVKRMGGMILAHLHFTERFLLSNRDWGKVLKAGWFPFLFLSQDLWNKLLASIRNGWELQDDEQRIHESWLNSCDDRLDSWRANRHFSNHIDFLDRAIRAYKEGDWLTVVSVAAPRVEGLIRQAFGVWGKQRDAVGRLAKDVKQREHARSLLFPDRLTQYFDRVFFRFTQFSAVDLPNNRHTLAHGLVTSNKLTRKEALTLLLLIDHILYCMPSDDTEEAS